MRRLATVCVVLAALARLNGVAAAQDLKDRFNVRAILSGMYSGETQRAATEGQNQASIADILYGDLRLILDGRKLASDHFDLHLDARVRVTDDYNGGFTSQGYMDGREYELHEAWGKFRGGKIDFGIGRMIINEADALRIDGVRLWAHLTKHWDLSVFAGALPNPYSRSVLDDYAYGAYAAGGGAAVAYTYDRIWGSFAAVGAYLGGPGDGGPAVTNACTVATTPMAGSTTPNMLVAPSACTLQAARDAADEVTRSYLTWTNYVRPISWFDFYHNIVVDVAGAAGAQLTQLDALATFRLQKWGTVRLGYDHMSSIALDNYLHHYLADHAGSYVVTKGATPGTFTLPTTIENNIAVERTARNEGRLQLELLAKDTTLYTEGRFRQRAILQQSADYRFFTGDSQVAPGVAGDVTLGVRDRGSLAGLRTGAYGMYIKDYRSEDFIASFNVGRSFHNDLFSIDAFFTYSWSKDQASTATGAAALCPSVTFNTSPTNTILATCFGGRDGNTYEVGLTPTMLLSRHWFLMADYRLVIDQTTGTYNESAAMYNTHAIITNNVFLRIEARY
jgi:hypothetical protein